MSEWRGDEDKWLKPEPRISYRLIEEEPEREAHWLHRRGWQDVRDFAIILVAIAVVVLIGVVIAR